VIISSNVNLQEENAVRSHAIKNISKAYLAGSSLWQKCQLVDVRTIPVGSWFRGLPVANSSCARIRNLMSVLFNLACRYERFDRNPICLVRQSAKRRVAPTLLLPAAIKRLLTVKETSPL
jgi:integrase